MRRDARRRVAAPVVSAADVTGGASRVADRILVPGRCRGDLQALSQHFGVPVERGPEELKDLPRHFSRSARAVDLRDYEVAIFAEIVDAPRLSVPQILARAQAYVDDGANVIDVREPGEYVGGHIPGAVLMPMGLLPSRAGELDRSRPLYVICASGNRSKAMADYLRNTGFDARSVSGGTSGWVSAGRPVVTGTRPNAA